LAINLATGLTMSTAPELTNCREDRRIAIAVCIFLTLAIWLVFGQTARHGFINFDDDKYVYQNAEISRGLTVDGLKGLLIHSHARLWHPLTTLTHMIDCQVYGLRPGGHHFTNVVLHNVAAVLLFLALSRMTGYFWRSAFVAAIFAIHPMRVESVAWVAERKDELSGVFFALTLDAYVRYARAPGIRRYVAMSILLVCGLMSKATFVTVPLVLLLLDYWPLGRWQGAGSEEQGGNSKTQSHRAAISTSQPLNSSTSHQRSEVGDHKTASVWTRLIIEKIPLVALSLVASAVTVFVQTVTMPSLEQLALLPRIKNACVSIIVYLRQMFWPSDLAVFYPHPRDQLNIWIVLGSVSLIVAITLVAVLCLRKRPYLFVGWFWYLILLFPVLGFFQAGLQSRADRFTYLPHIGITIAVTWAIADLAPRWRYRRAILTSTAICVVAAFAICAWKQTTYWRDNVSLWKRTIAVTSNNQIAHQNLAAALWARGDTAEARTESRIGNIIHAEASVKDFPLNVPARDSLGALLVQGGDVQGAIAQWETSLQIEPNDGNALNNLAWIFATYPDDSIRNGQQAVRLAESATVLPGGDAPIVLRTLAAAFAESGDFAKAMATTRHAIELAESQGNHSLVETLRHELELYQAQKPYRESPAD
jgi:tetratricopeptide (TPR) repeat protein